jgi:hypothetical protein
MNSYRKRKKVGSAILGISFAQQYMLDCYASKLERNEGSDSLKSNA